MQVFFNSSPMAAIAPKNKRLRSICLSLEEAIREFEQLDESEKKSAKEAEELQLKIRLLEKIKKQLEELN